VKLDWLHRRVREIVDHQLSEDADPEIERLLVGGAIVTREGDHYRIERGGETWEELERLARASWSCPGCGTALASARDPDRCPRCPEDPETGSR